MKIEALTGTVHVGARRTVGPVSLFPLWCEAPPLTGHATSVTGELAIMECDVPTVPRLVVTNTGTAPVLLLEGETLRGGQQDRVNLTSQLLAPQQRLEVPVACVEQGRWSHSDQALRRHGHGTPTIRARNGRATSRSSRAGTGWMADQSGTWTEVERLRAARGAVAPTSSLHDVDEQGRRDTARAPLPRPLEGQRGVVLGFGGRVRSLDLFANSSDLADHWDAILAAGLLEAEMMAPGTVPAALARRFVRTVMGLSFETTPAIGAGGDLRANGKEICAAGLVDDDRLLHLGAFDLALAA